MKVSKYLRGSGRVLAFVFVASVLWLLFDMAALRLSNTDVNGQLMKEFVLKERELAKKKNLNPTRFGQNPVQKVNPDVEKTQRSEMLRRQVEVYRRKNSDRIRGENKAALKSGGNFLTKEPRVGAGNDSRAHADTEPLGRNGILEKQNAPSNKVSPLMGANVKKKVLAKTKAPSAGQEGKRVKVLPNGTRIPLQDLKIPHGGVLSNKSTNSLNVKLDASKTYSAARSTKQEHSIIKGQMVDRGKSAVKDNKTDSLPGKTLVQVTAKPPQSPLNASDVQTGELLSYSKNGSLHKVMNLDVTLKPRDARALGQFGWAAEVPVDDLEESKRRWSEGYFNVFLSEQIPVDRAIPDTRPSA